MTQREPAAADELEARLQEDGHELGERRPKRLPRRTRVHSFATIVSSGGSMGAHMLGVVMMTDESLSHQAPMQGCLSRRHVRAVVPGEVLDLRAECEAQRQHGHQR